MEAGKGKKFIFMQTYLDIRCNNIRSLPAGIMVELPNLERLQISYNLLEEIPSDLVSLKILNVEGNPLSKILPEYRKDDKVGL